MKKTKIIIIEDDRFLNKLYSDKLESSNFEVLRFLQGEDGLNNIELEKPDLILLDLILPIKSGFEILTEIKNNLETKDIPVVILSNLNQEKDIKKGMELGAISYLNKIDISINDLPNIINNILKKVKE